MGLDGARILVTGSSRGIGRAIAIELARQGAHVVVHGPEANEELRSTFDRITANDAEALMIPAELSDAQAIASLFSEIVQEWGGLDALVNNAAVQTPWPVLDLPVEDWDRIMAVNLRAPFLCAQHAAKIMIQEGKPGRIVNISSVHAHQPRRNFAHYSTSKGGIEQLTRCLALELGVHQIQVNSVVAGAIATGLTPEDRAAAFATAIPMGRVGNTGEVARLVAFLCSGDCPYLTGASITVDGGLTLGFCASRQDL